MYEYEIKNTDRSFKDVDTKEGVVIGYFSSFGDKDSDGDIFVRGAYARTIRERGPNSSQPRIKHLLNHDTNQTVAKILKLEEDAIGLRYESKAGRHTLGQDWLKMCEDGLITEHSVGFKTIRKRAESSATYLLDVDLWEGTSCTCWGANQNTPIIGVKSDKIYSQISRLEKAMHSGTYSDETYRDVLEPEYKRLKTINATGTNKTTAQLIYEIAELMDSQKAEVRTRKEIWNYFED